MLYASTRANLLKGLGSTLFTDSIFATTKNDLTPDAYQAHLRHQAAPKPLSSREQEIADLKIAENAAASYEGSRSRASHVGTGVGLNWTPEAEQAIAQLAEGDQSAIVILVRTSLTLVWLHCTHSLHQTIDPTSESLLLKSASDCAIEQLPSALPSSEPCHALLAWTFTEASASKREIGLSCPLCYKIELIMKFVVFIYSCPSSSPIKHRMLYSSGSSGTHQTAKTLLTASSPSIVIASRKIETSDPKELDEAFLRLELGKTADGTTANAAVTNKPFAKPRGPAGRRR